ncbi:MAG: phosphatase PAP2 family protein [Patescibacteria group bacterium]|nr:phosphatase PAP2 family protein [Patescibacteria group bacterium]
MDFLVFQLINNFALKYLWLDTLAIFLTKYLPYLLIGILILLLIKNFKKYLPMVIKGFASAIFSGLVLTQIIRWFWFHPRPFIENEVNLLLTHSPSSSFPSAHTAFFFALSTIIYFYNKRTGIFFFLGSFLIGLARIFSGLHWPSDILGGIVLGILSGWLIYKFFQKTKLI